MEAVARETIFRLNKWGVFGLIAWLLAYAAVVICVKFLKMEKTASLVPYIVLQLIALWCGIVAAARGSKWWLVMPLITAGLAIQALLALLTE